MTMCLSSVWASGHRLKTAFVLPPVFGKCAEACGTGVREYTLRRGEGAKPEANPRAGNKACGSEPEALASPPARLGVRAPEALPLPPVHASSSAPPGAAVCSPKLASLPLPGPGYRLWTARTARTATLTLPFFFWYHMQCIGVLVYIMCDVMS